MKIGIAGAGGIGSNVAANLVRSGIDELKIVDFDRVEASNLNRQFYFHDQIGRFKVEALIENLKRIRPEVRIEVVVERIAATNCLHLFFDCDLIVEGLDCQEDKKMLVEQFAGNRVVVSACGIAGSDCTTIRTRRLGNCTFTGDFITDCVDAPLYAHKVATVANYMTQCILQQGIAYDKTTTR